jgi:hypothetical protein
MIHPQGAMRPLWPFGWGLHYSNFSLTHVAVILPNQTTAVVQPTQRFLLAVNVSNSAPRAGRATLQVYSTAQLLWPTTQAQPVNRLLCWSQVEVPATGVATDTISCAASDLGMCAGRRVLVCGPL